MSNVTVLLNVSGSNPAGLHSQCALRCVSYPEGCLSAALHVANKKCQIATMDENDLSFERDDEWTLLHAIYIGMSGPCLSPVPNVTTKLF